MFCRLQKKVINPDALDDVARERLIDEMYATHCEIFEGVPRRDFAAHVVQSTAKRNRICLVRDSTGRLVGYAAVHFFDRSFEGVPTTIVRGEVGFLRTHRGYFPVGPFFMLEIVRQRILHPRRPIFILACPIHPASYLAVCRRAPRGVAAAGGFDPGSDPHDHVEARRGVRPLEDRPEVSAVSQGRVDHRAELRGGALLETPPGRGRGLLSAS